MDERAYQHIADATFARIERALNDVDPDDLDCERAGDVLTFTFKSGARCVINTQRPTRQIWLAAIARAWHFGWSAAQEKWLDDKGEKGADGEPLDLFAAIRRNVRESSGLEVAFA
jgi:CyaY protein